MCLKHLSPSDLYPYAHVYILRRTNVGMFALFYIEQSLHNTLAWTACCTEIFRQQNG